MTCRRTWGTEPVSSVWARKTRCELGLAQGRSTALEGGSVSLTIEEQSQKINPQMKFTPEAAFALAAAVEVRCHSPVR
ncbi:hypothetical protein EBL89_16270 [Cereibacter sphaeroides]|nr:hypothetical protein EBL89_16270 [Cereibacter sphaeroides]